ncbi:Mediator of RNA polymerase II transcription subunit 7 [Scheffersomyces spartinae]|uniref:Mediator of RNA polymerase II transcription subunit 7 n=1 Tax=Scheffersomyces spartinae TaxID=45513 RepID=A0A9P7V9L4_9ASCO|nr:Mediator of RNA polymerase II transcription subunit 7 [Scheffersomyces spartinae]KAG7193898.1 Mediator of RNA polymerase II transcription subunit 7 [Scheffersomyces spartinae]
MNDNDISSLYPPPPPYYKYFTKENIARFNEWKKQEAQAQDEPLAPPGELKLLVPPQVPSGTHYRGYGNLWLFEEKLPSLKDSGWKQLYTDDDDTISSKQKIEELHKLMDSLLVNFLELIGVMSVNPSEFHLKIEDLKLILININHLLNSYRPHQTRETLIMLLRKQIESKKKDITEIEDTSNKIKQKIASLVDSIKVSEPGDQHLTESTQPKESLQVQLIEDNLLAGL